MVALGNTFGTQFAVIFFFTILTNFQRSSGQTTTTTGTTSTTSTTTPTTGTSTECVKGACNTENMPQLTETDPLEIKIYYHGMHDQATVDLINAICDVISSCGTQITINYMMGAYTETVSSELFCGAYGCDRDRLKACQQLLSPADFNTCVAVPIGTEEDLDACFTNEADDILLNNAQARRDLGIQFCEVPTVVFNDIYDPCVDITSSDTLISYVCNMYGSALDCCSA